MEADLSWIVVVLMAFVLIVKALGGCSGGGTCG
jgi:hypothetical protein